MLSFNFLLPYYCHSLWLLVFACETKMNQRKVAQAVDRTVKKGLKVTQKVVRNLIQNAPKREVSIVESIKGLTGEKHFFEESISVSPRTQSPSDCIFLTFGRSVDAQVKDVKTLLDDKTGAAGDAQKTEGLKWLLAVSHDDLSFYAHLRARRHRGRKCCLLSNTTCFMTSRAIIFLFTCSKSVKQMMCHSFFLTS